MANNEPEPLESKLLKWIKKTGYPHEMRVARIFREAGFDVVQSEHYTDLESNTSREIDVFATKESPLGGDFHISIDFYVECKVSISKPWLIFTAPSSNERIPSLELHRWEIAPQCGRETIFSLRGDEALQSLEMFKPEHLGYGSPLGNPVA
jgi:hypothetical protein